jgi:hypothetical protein
MTAVIIRVEGDSLLFITQPDHARLAADAIERWQADGFPAHPMREVILLAAREHDNGWLEEDSATHVDRDGTPLDFVSVPAEVRHRIWPRAAGRIAPASPYAAALIAQHALSVYSSTRCDPAWQNFFRVMTEMRNALLARSGMALETLERDYPFVNAADRISLAFCTGWTQPLESYGRRIILSDRNTVLITPDPFSGARVPLRVPARRLPRGAFDSSDALRSALDDAPHEFLDGVALGTA